MNRWSPKEGPEQARGPPSHSVSDLKNGSLLSFFSFFLVVLLSLWVVALSGDRGGLWEMEAWSGSDWEAACGRILMEFSVGGEMGKWVLYECSQLLRSGSE